MFWINWRGRPDRSEKRTHVNRYLNMPNLTSPENIIKSPTSANPFSLSITSRRRTPARIKDKPSCWQLTVAVATSNTSWALNKTVFPADDDLMTCSSMLFIVYVNSAWSTWRRSFEMSRVPPSDNIISGLKMQRCRVACWSWKPWETNVLQQQKGKWNIQI